jgi:predicted DNA-binding protein (UPF0251 family)
MLIKSLMGRQPYCRKILQQPPCGGFEPHRRSSDEVVVLALDELEAVRLADLEGLYHVEAAQQMGVSRPTFGRVLQAGRRKIATALVNGLALRIQGGPVCSHQGECPCPKRHTKAAACPMLRNLDKSQT